MSDFDKMKATQPHKVLPGVNEDLELYGHSVIIRKRSFLPRIIPGMSACRTIYPHEIVSVKIYSDPTAWRDSLQLTLQEADDVAIVFDRQHEQLANEIRDSISDMVTVAQRFPS